MKSPDVRAVLFDVFGTLVDWRTRVAREVAGLAAGMGVPVDAGAVADAWRAMYQPSMRAVRSGRRPWTPLDVLHRESLDVLLPRFGLDAATPADRHALTMAWHRLDPWHDTVPGLLRLSARFTIAPMSNGNVALLEDLARHGGLPWHRILGAETSRAYKPLPQAYLRAVGALGLRPGQVMLCAAHNDDLAAARAVGLRTAFVPRPAEHGPGQRTDLAPTGPWDVVATDIPDLAGLLGT
ncbi:MAG: haloacid dehalogenase type II [Thermoleophilia bacterium]|nr:haloacid dehalogenase type II [Thermoleophilia bacterium]